MASIRQRNGKWQVQVRRTGHKSINRIFKRQRTTAMVAVD